METVLLLPSSTVSLTLTSPKGDELLKTTKRREQQLWMS